MYKYQPWSSGNEDCFSWKAERINSGKSQISASMTYKAKDDKEWNEIKDLFGIKTNVSVGIPAELLVTKKNRYKGKDNNMTNITVKIMGGKKTDYARAIKAEFDIDAPKFNTGDKIKFSADGSTNWKQGVIYSLNKKITVSKTGDEKEFKADKLQWFYTIIETGNLKTWNGIKEEAVRVDDTPDYNKYFDFLDKQGVKLDRTRYTWKKFVQTDCIKYVNYYYGSANPHAWETEYLAVLCDKSTKKNVEFKGTQVGNDKLPAISEKC